MYRLSSIIPFLLAGLVLLGQSPHGEEFRIDCGQCHTPSGWEVDYRQVSFDHSTTRFDLEGMHADTDCRSCHASMIFSEVESDCISCHEDVHSMTVGNDCARCHTPESWLVDEIPELHEANGFPLMGAHGSLSCVECHVSETNLRFDRLGNECINCHQDDYLAARNPNHQQAGYSTVCTDCHSPLGFDWSADPISHDFFPLTGGHDILDCSQCHTTGNFSDASPECIACHQDDFNATTQPSHTALGLSTNCAECHTLDPGWQPARFDIHDDFHPLNGAHAAIATECLRCHQNGYDNTPNTCFGCHADDYANADDPDHASAGFPTDCASCHSEDDWEPADFDHDGMYFPIYSGKHRGEWDDCRECHDVPGDYSVFTCFTCHTRPDMDDEHSDERDYVYENAACLRCHPDGEE